MFESQAGMSRYAKAQWNSRFSSDPYHHHYIFSTLVLRLSGCSCAICLFQISQKKILVANENAHDTGPTKVHQGRKGKAPSKHQSCCRYSVSEKGSSTRHPLLMRTHLQHHGKPHDTLILLRAPSVLTPGNNLLGRTVSTSFSFAFFPIKHLLGPPL
jgi:ribosomal protein L21E